MSEEPRASASMTSSRRSFLLGGLAATGVAMAAPTLVGASAPGSLQRIKALIFDMQGTVFDFYHPISRVASEIAQKHRLPPAWATRLPGAWSGRAHDLILGIARGDRPWMPNSEVYRETLESLLTAEGIDHRLSSADRHRLLDQWADMVPWPDVRAGLTRLRRRFLLSTLTNASMAQMIGLVKRGALPFDALLTGELNHSFKPNPRVYQMAVNYLGCAPDTLLMVSAHKWDLLASKQEGFHTAYVPRPMELGLGHPADLKLEWFIDVVAVDLLDLAGKLGC